ncbi:hypothetical protein LCGC14_1254060 [marine sediment metagenome]|uniref:Uncharacterized protein n=1 Tax=marine sediment metagenome TaxID=412755 RepID=A0A0F9L2K0_9ZZZZ
MEEPTGVHLIAKERYRQVNEEGYSDDYDAHHTEGQLAMAATCYAAPRPLYIVEGHVPDGPVSVTDPWPAGLEDKRRRWLDGKWLLQEKFLGKEERLRHLAIAGALIAAEIDRLQARRERV